MNLQNATVLVTGGTSGIGRGVARVLTQAGAKVAVTGRDDARLLEVARELGVLAVKADVSSEAEVERTYSEVLGAFGHLDVLVNNTGAGSFAPLVDMALEEFESIISTNVTGAMLMARAAARHFVKRRSGNIINIGSTAGLRGAPNGTAYYASKFALRGMTECWRQELRSVAEDCALAVIADENKRKFLAACKNPVSLPGVALHIGRRNSAGPRISANELLEGRHAIPHDPWKIFERD